GGNSASLAFPVVVASKAPTLAVTLPATVTSDADASAPGVQANATVVANSEAAGTVVTYWSSVTGSLGFGRSAKTSLIGTDNTVTFPVDLAEGANTVKICVKGLAGLQTCDTRAVTVSTGRPSCRITAPVDSDVRGSAGASPTLTVETAASSVSVQVYNATGTAVGSPVTGTASNGVASVPLSLAADGTYKFVASCGGGGVSQAVQYTLDTAAPAIGSADVRGDTAKMGQLGPAIMDSSVR